MNIYVKSLVVTSLEWFGIPAFIYFLFWNPFNWSFEIINPTTMTTSFWAIGGIVLVVSLASVYMIIADHQNRNKTQNIEITYPDNWSRAQVAEPVEQAKTEQVQIEQPQVKQAPAEQARIEQPRVVKDMTFRDTLFSKLSDLKDALGNILGSEKDPATNTIILSGKEIFLSLDTGSIVYNGNRYAIDRNAWLDEGGRQNIQDIIRIIESIEEYIEGSAESPEGKEFYFNLLRSYLGASETKIIGGVLQETGTHLKVFG